MSRIVFLLDPCDTLPCVNGTCIADNNTCACIAGYRGRLCEEGRFNSTIVYVEYVSDKVYKFILCLLVSAVYHWSTMWCTMHIIHRYFYSSVLAVEDLFNAASTT